MKSGFDNLELLEELYSKYQEDPLSVDETWRNFFSKLDTDSFLSKESLTLAPLKPAYVPSAPADLRVYNLIEAYRTYGHLRAKVNPIETHTLPEKDLLTIELYGFNKGELSALFPTCGLLSQEKAPLLEIINALKRIYCDKIGFEYMGLQRPELERWLQTRIETDRFRHTLTIEQKHLILQYLNKSELFESFLHTKYVGQKRFSLEGGETLIPMLAVLIEKGAEKGIGEFVIGMAHRGRINVLSNILNKSYSDVFSEFEEGYIPNSFAGSGDVKYHKGFFATVQTPAGTKVKVSLTPNPSHLESVDPVVEGQVRAKQVQINDQEHEHVIPILVHGDAALSGQGVVYETLQLYRLEGYTTGGTIHFVINNQIGFTTLPRDSRSTLYCTDIARSFGAPVFHVNGEDPEGCVYATLLALELRQKFHCDVFIDLNCYRKYGHNETDEPAFTQPLEYQIIRKKRPIREIYRDELIEHGMLEKYLAESLEEDFKKALHQAMGITKLPPKTTDESKKELPQKTTHESTKTNVSLQTIKEVAKKICEVPTDLSIHPKLANLTKERLSMVEGTPPKPIDWGMAELLAYGTLLWDGTHVRISGQDCGRGTFSHRHGLWMDQVKERTYFPLQHIKADQGLFELINSPLSEYAVLGFEFGYSTAWPEALVVWEAQFGDFANGAQIMIDQYISTAEQKWGQKFGLVLLLPHGYEGQGPEHSSGRMERFLTLCGHDNLQIVNPTTPAQLFHLLRRQILQPIRKPLVVFTPKGLLRHPQCISQLSDLTEGQFNEILDDPSQNKQAQRLVFCNGRVYYDLIAEKTKSNVSNMAFIRIEQLYPLDKDRIKQLIASYKNVKEFFWVQEEPKNMGAWGFIHSELEQLLPNDQHLHYVGRECSASPAVGSHAIHKKEHLD